MDPDARVCISLSLVLSALVYSTMFHRPEGREPFSFNLASERLSSASSPHSTDWSPPIASSIGQSGMHSVTHLSATSTSSATMSSNAPTLSATQSPEAHSALPLCVPTFNSSTHYMPGQWVKLPGEASIYAPPEPCCGWDGDVHDYEDCASISDYMVIKPEPGKLIPAGGHGCRCSASRVAALLQWDWVPSHCTLLPWDPVSFCNALAGRRITFVGDSTMQQLSSAIMNLVSRAEVACAVDVSFVHSDTLTGESFGILNRGLPFLEAAERTNWPELMVLNAGMHINNATSFSRVLNTVKGRYAAALANSTRLPRLIWATSVGAPCSVDILPSMPRDVPGYWEAQVKARGAERVFNHNQLESWDDAAIVFWSDVSWASVWDLRPLWYRSDAKVNPSECDDAVHFCMPGPFRSVAAWLTAHLSALGAFQAS